MKIPVRLSPELEIRGARAGWLRQENALLLGLTPRWKSKDSSLWTGHIEGACAELCVSLALNLPWTGEHYLAGPGAGPTPPDVGQNTEVKWSTSTSHPTMTVAKQDNLDRFFVLVSGYAPDYILHGFLRGHEVPNVGTWTTYTERSVWRVPAANMRDLALREAV